MEIHPLLSWLQRKKMRQIELARKLDVTPYYIYLILKGDRWPSYKLALTISDMTDIPIEVLLSFRRNN